MRRFVQKCFRIGIGPHSALLVDLVGPEGFGALAELDGEAGG